jgi:predicted MFS family arabinose efflux permease
MTDLLRNRNLTLVLLACTLFGFVLGQSQLIVPLYTLTLSDSPLVLAVVVGVFPLTAVFLSLASGAVSEFLGSRVVIVAGFGLMVAGCLILTVARSWQVVLVAQVLLGLGDVAFWIPAYTFLARLAPPGRQYAVQGLGASAQQVGTILGPFAGGFVARALGFPPAFLLGGGLALGGLVAGICMRSVHDERDWARPFSTYLVSYHRRSLGFLVGNRAVLWASLVHAVILLTWPVMRGSFYLAFLSARGLTSADAGLIVSGHLLVGSLAGLCLGRLSAGHSMQKLLLAVAVFGALSVGVTPLLPGALWIAVVGCVGGIVVVYMPMVLGFLVVNGGLPERSMGVALMNLSWGVISPTGVLIVGLVVDRVSLSAAFFATETFVLACVVLLWIWARRSWR